MKATGIVRRVDDLGRVVIPRDIRRRIGILEGTPLEIFIDSKNNSLVLTPYKSEATLQLKGIAKNLSDLGTAPKHREIAKKIEKIAEELEELEELEGLEEL